MSTDPPPRSERNSLCWAARSNSSCGTSASCCHCEDWSRVMPRSASMEAEAIVALSDDCFLGFFLLRPPDASPAFCRCPLPFISFRSSPARRSARIRTLQHFRSASRLRRRTGGWRRFASLPELWLRLRVLALFVRMDNACPGPAPTVTVPAFAAPLPSSSGTSSSTSALAGSAALC
jgi:hypothetical protein